MHCVPSGRMPLRRSPPVVLLALAAPLVLALLVPSVVAADSDFAGGPDENSDIPTPGPVPEDTRPVQTLATPADAEATIFAAAVARVRIDDFRYDELVLEGTAKEVCAGRLLTGSGWTFNEIVSRFGGSAGTMYFCRERWDTANDPACNGQQANPVTTPNFHSTCWSNHARGRAIDIMVGRVGSGYNRTRGLSIVNWLLARDAQGNVNANARKLGIQQILFADRCWNSDGDRGIANWNGMRECGIGHHDHVHLDLTLNGANGNVSYWGRTPVFVPKMDTQALIDFNSGWRQAVSWWNLVPTDDEGQAVGSGFDRAIVGDWSGDGVQDEIIVWDRDNGTRLVQSWHNGDSRNATWGRITLGYDEIIAGDWDSDGRVDDTVTWNRDNGSFVVQSWYNYAPTTRYVGKWTTGYDKVVAGDMDGDGRVDDVLIWDLDRGAWVVQSFAGFRPTYRYHGTWSRTYDEVIFGDWSAGGDMDEMLVWDRQTGLWVLQSWVNFRNVYRRHGYWSTIYDIAAPGDYDHDGRVDDLFLYDTSSGRWTLVSHHRLVPSTRLSGTWNVNYDAIGVGAFVD